MYLVTMDPSRCVGCRNCEYACSFMRNKDFQRKYSMIRMNFYPEMRVCIPLTCLHCPDAFCMEVCPAAAIKRDGDTGAVIIDAKRCAGCKMCMMACPFGNIHYDAKAKVSLKCDLCLGEPNCVKFCISGALQYVDEEEAYDDNRSNYDARLQYCLRHENHRGTE